VQQLVPVPFGLLLCKYFQLYFFHTFYSLHFIVSVIVSHHQYNMLFGVYITSLYTFI